jgi:hypothetical protein
MSGGSDRRVVTAWIERWGFATLVGSAAVVGFVVAVTVAVPTNVPAIALRAAPVYRLEVGAALFAGLYLASMAFVLALRNHAFAEIGTSGMRAHDLGRLSELAVADRRAFDDLAALTAELRKDVGDGED